jgi:hypothetical protein
MTMGLVQAARQIESYGRGPDRSLAHISPDESAMLDYMQGGRRVNPVTGLAEYGAFGNILKAVAKIGASTVGFMYGGPLGAAAASAAVSKLTGDSWKSGADNRRYFRANGWSRQLCPRRWRGCYWA